MKRVNYSMFRIRTFHPVGQGAFYSERHGSFCLVYDCGTSSKRRSAIACLDAFAKGFESSSKHIDLLCISHFDSDHVNLIDELKKRVSIGCVLLPQLHDVEKILLLNLYRALQYNADSSNEQESNHGIVIELLENPSAFFGEETKIIYVKAADTSEESAELPLLIDNLLNEQDIPSYTPLLIGASDHWQFIPYNHLQASRQEKLITLLEESLGFNDNDIESLKTNGDFLTSRYANAAIRAVYKELEGTVNQNSMLLYSGPVNADDLYSFLGCCVVMDVNPVQIIRPGCLYTGDASLDHIQVREIFAPQWPLIGTLQIPHHGSKNGLAAETLQDSHFLLCPISAGHKNRYGHPHPETLQLIKKNNCISCLITENPGSELRLPISF